MRGLLWSLTLIIVFILSGCADVHEDNSGNEDEDEFEGQYAGIGEMVTHDTALGERGMTLEKVQYGQTDSDDGSYQPVFAVTFSIKNLSDDDEAHPDMEYRDMIIYSEYGDMGGASPEGGTGVDREKTLEPGEKLSVEVPFPKVEVIDDDEYTLKYSFGMFEKNDIVWEFDESDIEYEESRGGDDDS